MLKFAVLFLATSVYAVPSLHGPVKVDSSRDWRIVGGGNANNGQFPYQISIRQNGNHFCGGAIVSPSTIISAAHCVYGAAPWQFTVVAGSNKLSEGGDVYELYDIVVHPSYNSASKENDIAVLRLSRPMTANPNVAMIPLGTSVIDRNVYCIATGWGNIFYPGPVPNNLQFVQLYTIANDECKNRLVSVGPVFDTHLCTFTQYGQGTCHGDSGGPLVANGYLIGLVSWGNPCAVGYPDVFTRVSSYISWINQFLS